MAVEGATTREVFEAYVEHFLAPTLKPGQVVIMDNLGAHRPKRLKELIKGRSCELIYLPPYSPDFNPIEGAFSKIGHILRKTAARTKKALIEAMGRALESVVGTCEGSSLTVDTAPRRIGYENRCESSQDAAYKLARDLRGAHRGVGERRIEALVEASR
jgi:transposase